jgi:hypothetical protein
MLRRVHLVNKAKRLKNRPSDLPTMSMSFIVVGLNLNSQPQYCCQEGWVHIIFIYIIVSSNINNNNNNNNNNNDVFITIIVIYVIL